MTFHMKWHTSPTMDLSTQAPYLGNPFALAGWGVSGLEGQPLRLGTRASP